MWIEHYESDLNFLVVMSWHCMFLQYFLSVFLSIGVIVATQLFLYNLHCACILCVVYGRFLFNFLQGLYDCFAIVFDFDRSLRIHMRMWVCICKCHHVYCFVVTFVKYARKDRTKKNIQWRIKGAEHTKGKIGLEADEMRTENEEEEVKM